MIVRKPVNECRTAEEYSAANLPHGYGSGIQLIAWVAAYEEVAVEHVERARRGYPAPWLARKVTPADEAQILQHYLEAVDEIAFNNMENYR